MPEHLGIDGLFGIHTVPSGHVPGLAPRSSKKFPGVSEFDKVITLRTAFEIENEIIGQIPGMLSQRTLGPIQVPGNLAVNDGKDLVDALIQVQGSSANARADGEVNHHTLTTSPLQGLDNRCRQNGVAEAANADDQNAFRHFHSLLSSLRRTNTKAPLKQDLANLFHHRSTLWRTGSWQQQQKTLKFICL
jgi:hypothetical protein